MMIKRQTDQSFHGVFLILLLGGLLFFSVQWLYSKSMGFKYFKNYTYREYRYTPQNLMIDQDSRGVIYVANSYGVLEFDGASWQVIRVPSLLVFSLAIDEKNRIYTGGRGDIGFLTPDSKGFLQYTSLRDQLNDDHKNFPLIWPTLYMKDKVYFSCTEFLFQWDKNSNEMKVWKPRHAFDNSFNYGEKLFIYDDSTGLLELINGSFKPVPDGKTFAGKEMEMMAPYDNDGKTILIGTKLGGFYLYDGVKAVPFPTKADDYLRKNRLFYGIELKSCPGQFALATMLGGIVIIDSYGEIKYIFNTNTGLQDNHVSHIFEDSQGNLWLALSKGISRLEYSSPFEIYDERLNLPGTVLSIMKHRGDLYVGTTSGLYFLSLSSSRGFQQVAGIYNMCSSLLTIENSILAGTTRGIFLVEHGQHDRKRKVSESRCFALYQSSRDNERIWVGTVRGLASLRMQAENHGFQLVEEKKFENTSADIRTIVEDLKGNLWLGTLQKGVIKVDFPSDVHHPVVTWYDTSHGLPVGVINAYFAAGHVIFSTTKGIFRFDGANSKFIPDKILGEGFAGRGRVDPIVTDQNRNIWFNSNGYNIQAIFQGDGSFVLNSTPFRRIPPAPGCVIYPDPDDNTVWFGSTDGLIRYHPRVKKYYRQDFKALIRSVQSIKGKYPILGGNRPVASNNKRLSSLTLKYGYRNLHIKFAAPFFQDESRTRYQYFLEGHDKDWSTWITETHVDYPDLSPGPYTFRVRARNVYGQISSEDVLEFRILPPWYMTWWSYLGYALGFFLVIYLVVKWRSGKLEKEKLHLEQVIKDRTKEINEKNQQLKELDKIKSRFFANISHEFRTPLTLIMGPLEQMLSRYHDSELQENARLMLRNSQRLLNLVNQLLDLAKLDSGKMKLQTSRQDIVPFLKSMVASFESLAIQQRLELIFHTDLQDLNLYFDPEKLEKIIFNLLSNAVKFTPGGGKITVSLQWAPGSDENFPSGAAVITVKDTGMGIPASQLPHIFDRFHQAEDSYEHKQKGSGIGLALTRELVMLHRGEILVRSKTTTEGVGGTEFILRLPLGNQHLKSEEIVDFPKEPCEMSGETVTPGTGSLMDIAIEPINIIDGAEGAVEKIETDEAKVGEENVILVVEDSADMRNYIRSALEPLYQVKEAVDGKEGIEKAKAIIPDLIISDVMMPEADGYELCNTLKRDINTSHIPIILLTAKASEESVIQGLETGADDYITKPFNTQILAARIKNLIDLRRQLQLKRTRHMALQPAEISVSSIDEKFFHQLQDMIEKNLSDMEFNVEQLCKSLYIGRTSLYRKILALTGETPSQFMRSFRLQRAAQLLKANYGNVTEVAFAVGFSNTAYFTKCFKEKFHQLPSTFQSSQTSGQIH